VKRTFFKFFRPGQSLQNSLKLANINRRIQYQIPAIDNDWQLTELPLVSGLPDTGASASHLDQSISFAIMRSNLKIANNHC
jgi:hypothetical protein